MPFWWRRRRRFWLGKTRYQRRTRRKRWPRRRIHRRRRFRRTNRRRRKRRYKVRRKKKTIPIRQWQPDSIVKCRIKGFGVLVLGADGKQLNCWTPNKENFTPPKTPCGGGFGVEQFTLQYLYEEQRFHHNIWTKTNMYKDLCRYLFVRFTFYRHPYTDFIISYERQPPFDLNKWTYPSCHPSQLLLGKHKKILLSKQTKPNGKTKLRLKIRPPKQMITKWFFTEQFSKYALLLLKAAAANFNHSFIQASAENQQVTIIFINTGFYQTSNWGTVLSNDPYTPWATTPTLEYYYWKGNTKMTGTMQRPTNAGNSEAYYKSVNYDTGYFQPTLLQAFQVKDQAQIPCGISRYNPNIDSGKGNVIWLKSTLTNSYNKPIKDTDMKFEGLPLWLMFYGWFDYLKEKKGDQRFLDSYCIMIQSPAIHFYSSVFEREPWFLPIDRTFYEGKAPYEGILTSTMKKTWFPTLQHQMQTINAIVETSPFVPKYTNITNATWELKYTYDFHFKWGGPEITDQAIEDPSKKNTYPVPDTMPTGVQIQNPEKQTPSSFIHAWDIRRGFITKRALKRMCEDIQTDTDFEPDTGQALQKKPRLGCHLRDPYQAQKDIQDCLRSLCEESSWQEVQEEEEEKNIQQLIQQQQQQQLQLKRNILKLITDLKYKQNMLQLQTGLME
nr:MAG: ORF1 [Torque teno midi virus]